jgi:DNA polymerase III subunit delta
MTFQDLFRELEKGATRPVYYFYGPEKWLIEKAVSKLKEIILTPATRDFNWEAFDAAENSADAILTGLQVFPMLSKRRLVMVRNSDSIWSKALPPFLEYLQNPNPATCAVFVGEKADLRTKFFQFLQEKGAAVAFYPPFEKELGKWLHAQARELGCVLSEGAAALLLERIGPNMQELKTELEKLSLGKGETRAIREEDVEALTGDVRHEDLFELPRAVADLRLDRALHLLKKISEQGEPPLLLFSLVMRQLRLALRAKELRAQGSSRKEVEGKLRIPPRRAEEFWRQTDRLPFATGEIWPLALETDLKMKTSRADKELVLEEYLWNLLLAFGRGKIARDGRKGED